MSSAHIGLYFQPTIAFFQMGLRSREVSDYIRRPITTPYSTASIAAHKYLLCEKYGKQSSNEVIKLCLIIGLTGYSRLKLYRAKLMQQILHISMQNIIFITSHPKEYIWCMN